MMGLFRRGNAGQEALVALGRLEHSVERLRADFVDEKKSAAESRAGVHRRLDDQIAELADVKTSVTLSRRAMEDHFSRHDTDVAPVIQEWRHIKHTGLGIVGLLAVGGVTIGGALAWASDAAVAAIRHWLKIG
ncbi:MAG: DUF1515 domain-containing protein [Methylacidiphilales bacterium]|nr:DUF1515 domain-containing protein [Candidatus Methylacidiphilales bacterium]